jgi:hypothetical protein
VRAIINRMIATSVAEMHHFCTALGG